MRLSRVAPRPDTYWVEPGRLLAGDYPGASSRRHVRRRVDALTADGVTSFVDLTEAQELVPYHDHAAELGATWRRFPVRDLDIPSRSQMELILAHIDAELAEGRVVYVHCWGGIGRTGTVVGCRLRDAGLSGDEAIAEIARLRQACAKAWMVSPQTDEQLRFINDWR